MLAGDVLLADKDRLRLDNAVLGEIDVPLARVVGLMLDPPGGQARKAPRLRKTLKGSVEEKQPAFPHRASANRRKQPQIRA